MCYKSHRRFRFELYKKYFLVKKIYTFLKKLCILLIGSYIPVYIDVIILVFINNFTIITLLFG